MKPKAVECIGSKNPGVKTDFSIFFSGDEDVCPRWNMLFWRMCLPSTVVAGGNSVVVWCITQK